MIRGIKFACVPTRDQDRALKFYTEKLGFRVMTDQPFGAQRWIELGIPGAESQVVLFTPEGQEDRIGGFQPLAFWTDDVFATATGVEGEGRGVCCQSQRRSRGERPRFSKTPTATSSCCQASKAESQTHT
jgi:catechol 2,3-dioxygenase-like lactoylglutathione lyase family enzyme